MPLHFKTPAYPSAALTRAARRPVTVKLDALQPSGSFKIRGVGHACSLHAARGVKRFVSSSGGNAGIAVAYAAGKLGLPAHVFVPQTTSARAVTILRELGAEVVIHGASWQEANERAQAELAADDAFIHPFDDPLLWTGHATLVDEMVADGITPDLIVLSVGGGGLLCGVAEGLQRHGLNIPILTVETHGTASFAQSVAAGHRITLPSVTGIATSLGAKQVSARAFDLLAEQQIRTALVSDFQAIDASMRFMDDHRILVEPACGAALAAAYGNLPELADARDVLVIVCGGTTASHDQCAAWQRELAEPPTDRRLN